MDGQCDTCGKYLFTASDAAKHRLYEAALKDNDALRAENERLRNVLRDAGLFLHHCWCDVPMNDYSFERLNTMIGQIDTALAEKEE